MSPVYLSTKGIVLLVIAIGLLQCSATQLSATSYTENNGQLAHHVYFLNYITIYLNLIFFPIHFIMKKREEAENAELQRTRLILVNSNNNNNNNYQVEDTSMANIHHQQENDDINDDINNINNTNGNDQKQKYTRSFTQMAVIVTFLYFCYIIANGAYSVALSVGTRPSITASIFAVCPVFVVFLSWCVLNIKPLFIHWIALVAGVTGVLVVLQPWKVTSLFSSSSSSGSSASPSSATNSETLLAIISSVLSPIFAALYKVYFSKFFQNSKWHEAGKILGFLTIPNLLVGTVIISVVLKTTNIEVSPFLPSDLTANTNSSSSSSFADVPASTWWIFTAARILGLAFNVVVNWGVTVVPPLYVSVGTILSTMCNIFADAMLGRGWPDPIAWFGMGLIIVSFICVAVSGKFAKKDNNNDVPIDDKIMMSGNNNNTNDDDGDDDRVVATISCSRGDVDDDDFEENNNKSSSSARRLMKNRGEARGDPMEF